MKSIFIPSKTYNLYMDGHRTFIHVPKEEYESKLEDLNFGETVRIVNKENEQQFTDEIFWFLYSFWEVERFIFLSFECKIKSDLHYKRMDNAKKIIKSSAMQEAWKIWIDPGCQQQLYYQIQAYSSFFFITNDIFLPIVKLIDGESESEKYVVIDELRIKTGPDLEKIISVHSLVPINLLYI